MPISPWLVIITILTVASSALAVNIGDNIANEKNTAIGFPITMIVSH